MKLAVKHHTAAGRHVEILLLLRARGWSVHGRVSEEEPHTSTWSNSRAEKERPISCHLQRKSIRETHTSEVSVQRERKTTCKESTECRRRGEIMYGSVFVPCPEANSARASCTSVLHSRITHKEHRASEGTPRVFGHLQDLVMKRNQWCKSPSPRSCLLTSAVLET